MKGLEFWSNQYLKEVAVANPTQDTIKKAYEDGVKFGREQAASLVDHIGSMNNDGRYKGISLLIKAIGNGDVKLDPSYQ